MIIGFDGRYAEGDLVGVGKYIFNLVTGVAKKGNSCIVFYSKKPKVKIEGATEVVLNSFNRYYFEQILLPCALKKNRIDLYHATGNNGIPFFCPIPSVLTVHDIIPLTIENYFSYSPAPLLSKLSYLFRLKTSLLKTIKIVTVSNFVKRELINRLNINLLKIQTIYSGASDLLLSGKLPNNLVGKKYILNHGGIDIRKNLDKLIEAFSMVQIKNPNIYLVITGNNPRIRKELDELIIKLNLKNRVIFTGYVEDNTLGVLIKNAELVCYPTLSEGFGFPILEAYQMGVPVISSNTTSIPEVAGNAAILINPENTAEIARVINKVLHNPKLVHKMVLKGKTQFNKFSWDKCIDEYIDLYNNI